MFTDTAPADTSSGKQLSFSHQISSAYPKKDQKYYKGPCRRQRRGQGQNLPVTGVNIILKKEKRDFS